MPSNEYDISRAFKRIENDLMESMMKNLKRHQVEETEHGMTWEQWQALQLQELEQYRTNNAKLFTDDFKQIDRKVDALFRNTAKNAQAQEENALLGKIKAKTFTPDVDKGGFFRLNESKLNALIMATQADFVRAEYAMLRRANDQYRQIIFDSMTYANVTNDYAKAVDMATHDFLKRGINSVVYKNGARHTVSDYASMALRTGNKRAYLMGEGNAHDKYGLHTVRVNKRQDACPKCVGFLGKLLIDDVYAGGTRAEAVAQGIPTLSDAIQAGFLHPNCKDMYSVYIPGVSQGGKGWTQEEITNITGNYNQEQEIQHAIDMHETYRRMAQYSLDPDNQAQYQTRADNWLARANELKATPVAPVVPAPPVVETPPPVEIKPFTEDEKEALEYYVSGDGMWLNNYLRGVETEGAILPKKLDADTQRLLDNLTSATNRPLEATDKLYRSVDAKVIFSDLSSEDVENMMWHIMYGDSQYDSGAYSQGIKKRMEQALNNAKGREITEKGFMSTTVDKSVAEEWGYFTGAENPVVIEFDTKGKALKGADLDFLDIADDPQRERLLARNTRYKITDIGVATDAEGGKYIKVTAEILDQAEVAETVAEEVVEKAVPKVAETTTEETTIRSRIAELKAQNTGNLLAEAEKQKGVLQDYYKTYEQGQFLAKANGKDYSEYLLEKIEKVHEKVTPDIYGAYYAEQEERYRYILSHLQEFENGTYADSIKAEIKDLKKKAKVWQKELDEAYNNLEAVIGVPNVSTLSSYTEKHTTPIKHFLDDAQAKFRNAWNECAGEFHQLSGTDRWGRRRKGAFYSAKEDGVYLNINKVAKGDDLHPAYETVFHEYGHNIDYVLNRKYGNGDPMQAFSETYKDGIFGKTLAEEAEKALADFGRENGFVGLPNKGTVMQEADNLVRKGLIKPEEKIAWVKAKMQIEVVDSLGAEEAFCKYIKENYSLSARGDISDLFEPVTSKGYPFGAGHGKDYWSKSSNGFGSAPKYIRHGKEAFAEMYASNIANGESWELIQKYFPKSVEIFNEMLEVVKL